MKTATIWAVEGFNDVTIDAIKYNRSWCYRAGIMKCKHDFSSQCVINTQPNINGWECSSIQNTDFTCNTHTITHSPTESPTIPDPTTAPTKYPTQNPTTTPTKSPTEPTTNPTNNPTQSPTAPTTAIPSINPTKIPTNLPTLQTINPTKTPSNSPTLIPSINPTISDVIISTFDEQPYKLIDRYPIGGIAAIFIFGGCFFCFCLFIIWRCKKFESKEHATQLEAQYRKKRAENWATKDSDHEEDGLMNNINNGISDYSDESIQYNNNNNNNDFNRKYLHQPHTSNHSEGNEYNDKWNRMKTKDEDYAKQIITQAERETKEREIEYEKIRKKMRTDSDQLFSKQVKVFATEQGQLDEEIFQSMANENGSDDEDIIVHENKQSYSNKIKNFMRSRSKSRSKSQRNNISNNNNVNMNPSPPQFVSVPSMSINGNGKKHKRYEHIDTLQEEV